MSNTTQGKANASFIESEASGTRSRAVVTREPLPPHNSVFDVSTDELDKIFDW